MKIYFFSNNFDNKSFGGMESHRSSFCDYFIEKYEVIKCSLLPLCIGDNLFDDIPKSIEYLNEVITDDDILFFNDCYWIDYLKELRKHHKHNQFLLRSGGNDLLAAHLNNCDDSLSIRQKKIVQIINETIDSLIINSDYSYYQNIELGINPRLMKKIRGGVDVNYCEELISQKDINRDALLRKHNIPKDKAIVTISSRFVPFKGIDSFIKNIASLFKNNKYHLLLIGDGIEKDKILTIANNEIKKDNFTYLGALSNKDALKYVSISNVFVNPSIAYKKWVGNEYYIHTETMGRSMMEAITLNIRVVASDVGGTKELFDEYGSIIELTNGDYQKAIINSQNKRVPIENKDKLDWKYVFKQYESLFDSWNNKQIVFSVDLDSTLIDKNRTFESLAHLKNRPNNSVLIINTCRIITKETLDLISPLSYDYLIYENGIGIYQYKHLIDNKIVLYFDSLFEEISNRYGENIKRTQPNCISIRHFDLKYLDEIKSLLDPNIAKVVVGPDIIKIVSLRCNKGATLEYLLKDLPYSQVVISAGDATNDIEMLNISDYSFCSSKIEQFVTSKHEVFEIKDRKEDLAKRIFNRKRIVISLTVIKERFPSLKDVITSILNQSVEPDVIAIYVDKYSFSRGDFTEEIYHNPKIRITYVDLDLKGHKKYFYSFKEYPNDYVITIDDDVVYHKDTVKELVKYHYRYPNSVICNRGRFIFLNDDGVASYKLWPRNPLINIKSPLLMATGCLGVLYEPNQFDPSIFNLEKIMDEDILTNDDIWLKAHELDNDIDVVITDLDKDINFAKNTQKSSLLDENYKYGRHDKAVKKLFDLNKINRIKHEFFDIKDGNVIYDGFHSTIYKKDGYIIKILHSKMPNSIKEIDKETMVSQMKDVNTHRVLGYLKQENKIAFDYLNFSDLPLQLNLSILNLVKTEISKINYKKFDYDDSYLKDLKTTLSIYENKFGESLYWSLFDDFNERASIHGDINLNNIKLVNNKIYIFDFENASYGPKWWDLMYFIADYPFENVSLDVLNTLSVKDIERIIFIHEIRIGRLIRKQKDLAFRKKNLEFYLKLLEKKRNEKEK